MESDVALVALGLAGGLVLAVPVRAVFKRWRMVRAERVALEHWRAFTAAMTQRTPARRWWS